MPREALFEFHDAFVAFLPENGVPKGVANYVTWMNRAARRLGRTIGPKELSTEADVDALIQELIKKANDDPDFSFTKGSKEESDQRSTFRKYVQMVDGNFRELFRRTPIGSISPRRFHEAFLRFQRIHIEESGWELDSFSNRDSFAFQWEGYKQAIPERAGAVLQAKRWKRAEIGSGEILRRVIAAIELPDNNLLQWQARQGPASRAHSRIYDLLAETEIEGRVILEGLFYDLYRSGKADEETFEGIVSLCRQRYELLGYLFFIADPGRFLPLRTRSFDKALAELGVELKTEGRCGWDNYLAFVDAIREVRMRLHAEGVTDATLLDAHSFCWIIARHKFTEVRTGNPEIAVLEKFSGSLRPGDVKREFSPNDDAEIRNMQELAAKCRASGQIAEEIAENTERNRLTKEGRPDLAAKVESVANRPGMGFDIRSFDCDGTERFIEVKNVSNGNRFFLSEGEWLNSQARSNYWFYLVSIPSDKKTSPKVILLRSDEIDCIHLRPVNYLVSFD